MERRRFSSVCCRTEPNRRTRRCVMERQRFIYFYILLWIGPNLGLDQPSSIRFQKKTEKGLKSIGLNFKFD